MPDKRRRTKREDKGNDEIKEITEFSRSRSERGKLDISLLQPRLFMSFCTLLLFIRLFIAKLFRFSWFSLPFIKIESENIYI